MPVKLEYLRPGHCPVCDVIVPQPTLIEIKLSNGSVMQQPVCLLHTELLKDLKTQEILVRYCKIIWCKEILESVQLSRKEKNLEMKRIKALKVVSG